MWRLVLVVCIACAPTARPYVPRPHVPVALAAMPSLADVVTAEQPLTAHDRFELHVEGYITGSRARDAIACHRMAAEMRDADAVRRTDLHGQIVLRASRHPACDHIARRLARHSLATAYHAWPRGRAPFAIWWQIVLDANRARPLPGADELTVAALANAVVESACEPTRLGEIRLLATAVRSTDDHPRSLDAELARLADVDPRSCRAP
jgi:hypothetical protein